MCSPHNFLKTKKLGGGVLDHLWGNSREKGQSQELLPLLLVPQRLLSLHPKWKITESHLDLSPSEMSVFMAAYEKYT